MSRHIFTRLFLNKSLEELFSMANLRKTDVGLPVNVWLDTSQYYKTEGHDKRLKFQPNKDRNFPSSRKGWSSIRLNGEIVEKTFKKSKSKLTESELSEIRNFTTNNAYALSCLADKQISVAEFLSLMIKGGKKASDVEIQKQKDAVDKIISEN